MWALRTPLDSAGSGAQVVSRVWKVFQSAEKLSRGSHVNPAVPVVLALNKHGFAILSHFQVDTAIGAGLWPELDHHQRGSPGPLRACRRAVGREMSDPVDRCRPPLDWA